MGTSVVVRSPNEIDVIYAVAPALTSAAHRMLGFPDVAFRIVDQLNKRGPNDAFECDLRGDVAAMLLMLLTSSLAFRPSAESEPRQKKPKSDNELVEFTTVSRFLGVLLPGAAGLTLHALLQFAPEIARGIITLRHFIASQVALTPEQIFLGVLSGTGFMTARGTKGIDAAFGFAVDKAQSAAAADPVFTAPRDIDPFEFDASNIGVFSLQVKNWADRVPPGKISMAFDNMGLKTVFPFTDRELLPQMPSVALFLEPEAEHEPNCQIWVELEEKRTFNTTPNRIKIDLYSEDPDSVDAEAFNQFVHEIEKKLRQNAQNESHPRTATSESLASVSIKRIFISASYQALFGSGVRKEYSEMLSAVETLITIRPFRLDPAADAFKWLKSAQYTLGIFRWTRSR